ncbi:MAG: bifunctional oligoribonuclease/PAP phosphatase NrnA [Lachnospiraceae bacterium]|nr:bifunctional oligoribonuclease/PAP phosphatase NrnA [Lachnospiraceae bacterium]
MSLIKDLDSILTGMNSVAIGGHIRPDGDCVGSTLATYNYLKKYYPNIEVKLFLQPIQDYFRFLNLSSDITWDLSEDKVFDLFIVLDCGDADRLGDSKKYLEKARHTACIDHHVSNSGFADLEFIYPEASSTCELVYELMDKSKVDKDIAECLYVGMVHDTGVFQYSCTSKKTMCYAGELMDKGIDYSKIVNDTFFAKTFNENRALGHALDKSRLYLDGKVVSSVFYLSEMEEYGIKPSELDSVVSNLLRTKGVEVSIFMYEVAPGELKVSTRSKGKVNVAELCMRHGGGGHERAAGCSCRKSYEDGLNEFLDELREQI